MAKNNFELLSSKESNAICSIDSRNTSLTTKPAEYIKANSETYYVLTNVWGNLFTQYAPYSWESIKYRLLNSGLVTVISELNGEADKFIQDKGGFLPFTLSLINELVHDGNWQRVLLLLLRFPKRFSPAEADSIKALAIDEFISIENRNKLIQRRGYNPRIVQGLREILSPIFSNFTVNMSDRYFSNGACSDGKFLSEKLSTLAKGAHSIYPEYPFHSQTFETEDYWESPRKRNLLLNDGNITESFSSHLCLEKPALVTSVPKTYKTARIIAEEETYRQFHNTAVYMAILRCMQSSPYYPQFCIEDQGRNRCLCLQASIDCKMSTLDLSHASDCVTKSLVLAIFPKAVVDELGLLPNIAIVNGKKRALQMAATAGCVLTFCLETLTFWSIARYAKLTYEALTGESIPDVSVYGDDIIVPTEIAEYTISILGSLGFIVNDSKSFFSDNHYRETCGAEYLNGYDVATRYWPRVCFTWDTEDKRVILGNNTNLALCSLIPLQHALFEHKRANAFIVSYIRNIIPNMSSSNPADGLQDLWEDFPVFDYSYPRRKRVDGDNDLLPDDLRRELHYYPIVKWPKNGTEAYREVFEMFSYIEFLQKGPYYDSPIMELLHCSTRRLSFNETCAGSQIKWIRLNP